LVFAGFHAPAFSTALFSAGADQFFFPVIETSDYMGTEADRDRLIQVLVDGHRAPGEGIPEPRLVDLPEPAPHRNRVIFGHDSLRLHREDPVQVAPAGASKRGALFLRRYRELIVELPDILLPQEGVGSLHRRDPASRSSCGRRPCHVPKLRSERPRACGE